MEDFISNNRLRLDDMYTEYMYSLYTCDEPLCFGCFCLLVFNTKNRAADMYKELTW